MGSFNLSTFLVSCSPPKFDLNLLVGNLTLRELLLPPRPSDASERLQLQTENSDSEPHDGDSFSDDDDDDEEAYLDALLHPFKKSESTEQRQMRIKAWEDMYSNVDTGVYFKINKVNFADDIGLKLVEEMELSENHPCQESMSSLEEPDAVPPLDDVNFELNFDAHLSRRSLTHKLLLQKVSLEKVEISSDSMLGIVWVLEDTGRGRVVTVRCSYDSWRTHSDVGAIYVGRRHLSTETDALKLEVYEFELLLIDRSANDFEEATLCFAIRLSTEEGEEFWDNNDSENFQVEIKKLVSG